MNKLETAGIVFDTVLLVQHRMATVWLTKRSRFSREDGVAATWRTTPAGSYGTWTTGFTSLTRMFATALPTEFLGLKSFRVEAANGV